MSSENGDVSVILKCIFNCNSLVPENVYELQFTGACKKHIINMNIEVIYVMEIDVNIVFPMDFSRLLTKTFGRVIITDQSFSCKEQNHLDHIDVSESAQSLSY